jgi:3-hydroxyacyl-[acyl-carrier-protein] dehydratase
VSRKVLEHHEIAPLVPYRWPWFFVDRVLEWIPNKKIVTQKVVSSADLLVSSHFAKGPAILPGVILVEFVCQSAYLLGRLSEPENSRLHYLGRCQASFLRTAAAGDSLTAHVVLEDVVQGSAVHRGTIVCGELEVCRVQIVSYPQGSHE